MSEAHSKEAIMEAAQACHEANAVLCRWATPDMPAVSWVDAPDWQRESAIDGVMFVIRNPHAPAGAQHDDWMEGKRLDGWVYGPDKDPEQKTHPCLVPFEDLPMEQQAKDVVFGAVAKAVLARHRRG